jgi:hypothetical protein
VIAKSQRPTLQFCASSKVRSHKEADKPISEDRKMPLVELHKAEPESAFVISLFGFDATSHSFCFQNILYLPDSVFSAPRPLGTWGTHGNGVSQH